MITHIGAKPLKALDLFCGAGGSSAGARLAGIEPVAAIDSWEFAAQIYGDNFPGAKVICEDMRDLDPKTVARKVGPIEVLIASPECTNHTCAKGSAPRDEASKETALQVWRYAKQFRPRWVVVENVVHMRKWSKHAAFKDALRDLGYHVSEEVLDATSFGVPQRRRRMFLVCDRDGPPPRIEATWKGAVKPASKILDPAGLWATRPLFTPRRARETLRRYHRGVAAIGAGKPFLIVYYGTDGGGGWQPIQRPLRTVTTLDRFGLVDPSDAGVLFRMLQVPELRRAMGFPAAFHMLRGSRREQIKVLGNAVCPPVMTGLLSQLTAG
jgi:DNA (cytosine-5)-methyltransferase 1